MALQVYIDQQYQLFPQHGYDEIQKVGFEWKAPYFYVDETRLLEFAQLLYVIDWQVQIYGKSIISALPVYRSCP